MDSSSWAAYGEINPELDQFLKSTPPRPHVSEASDVQSVRNGMLLQIKQGLEAGVIKPTDLTGVWKTEIGIPVRDGTKIRALVYRPESDEPGPLILHFHGGGWCIGFAEMGEGEAAYVCRELGATYVAVDYRKAPEFVFPTAPHDAWDSTKWVVANAAQIGADPSKGFVLSGTSAGANLAVVVAHEAADNKLEHPITGLSLNVPSVVHPDAVPEEYRPHYNSLKAYPGVPVLDEADFMWFLKHYKPDPKSPLMSPLLWPSGHKTQPPTYFHICGRDVLRDEGLIYEYVLREAGVKTKLDITPGICHAGDSFFPMLSFSGPAVAKRHEAYKWLLSEK